MGPKTNIYSSYRFDMPILLIFWELMDYEIILKGKFGPKILFAYSSSFSLIQAAVTRSSFQLHRSYRSVSDMYHSMVTASIPIIVKCTSCIHPRECSSVVHDIVLVLRV
jgi:hypothetical protein